MVFKISYTNTKSIIDTDYKDELRLLHTYRSLKDTEKREHAKINLCK